VRAFRWVVKKLTEQSVIAHSSASRRLLGSKIEPDGCQLARTALDLAAVLLPIQASFELEFVTVLVDVPVETIV